MLVNPEERVENSVRSKISRGAVEERRPALLGNNRLTLGISQRTVPSPLTQTIHNPSFHLDNRLASPNPLVRAARLLSPSLRLSPVSPDPLERLCFGDTNALKSESPVISLRSKPELPSARICDKPLFRNCRTGLYRVPE